jgi:protein tyrosine kinase modulator
MHAENKNLRDYVTILKRRKRSIILPILIIFSLAATVALVMPPVYKSKSTILIEEQDIPQEYILSTVTGFAEQRLQTINQRVMSSTKLLEIINRYNLYSDKRKIWTSEETIEKMRKAIKVDTISAEVDDPRAGRSANVTIAFSITYSGNSPAVVQQIANVLASLYLEENLKVRGQQSEGAAKFFQDEMQRVQTRMAELDANLAAYKQKNVDSLPELTQLNLQELSRVELAVEQMNDQLRAAQEKESSFRTQMEGIPSDAEVQQKAHLNELRVRLGNLKSRVSDDYPDVIKLKQEIAELEKNLKEQRDDAPSARVDNQSYVALAAQHAGTKAEIESLKRQIGALTRKRDGYRRRIEASPRVEEGYKALFIERTNVQAKYDDLMKKQMEANVSQGLEKGQMGERFTLIDPARLPEKPVQPNIPLILLLGLVFGASASAGAVALNEVGDKAVYTVESLTRMMSVPIIAGIPEIVTQNDINRGKKRKKRIIVAALLVLVVSIVAFNFLVMDLDVFWARLVRRLAL